MSCSTDQKIVLNGIDGSNPLAFLAALGTFLTSCHIFPSVRMSWIEHRGAWRPTLHGIASDEHEFADHLRGALQLLSTSPFQIDKRMPFAAEKLSEAIAAAIPNAPSERRLADFLAAFGSEIVLDGDNFVDTALRMVRSGDSAGQGFPQYALMIREQTDCASIHRSLFENWDYQDERRIDGTGKVFSLRWDPIEDSIYALRWTAPNKEIKNTMVGANSLALESLQLLPTIPNGSPITTTMFSTHRKTLFFTWPIWSAPLSTDVIRSLLSLSELHVEHPNRDVLASRGIREAFRSRRYAPNQYYRNFAPARSVGR